MRFMDFKHGVLACSVCIGEHLPFATGVAFSSQMRGTDQVAVAFLGDGTVDQGLFHESLNVASLWKLPVIYICENNLYGMSVSVERASCADLTKKSLSFDIPSESVDGMDVLAVRDTVGKWTEYAREGKGPSFVVANTYRYYGHSRSDPKAYRTREEEKSWRERDAIVAFSGKMQEKNVLTEKEVKNIEEEVIKEIEEAVEFAINSPFPEQEELYTDVYA